MSAAISSRGALALPDVPAQTEPALVYTGTLLGDTFAKTCHGLLRGSRRFRVLGVVDSQHAGHDAGEVMDGRHLGVPVVASVLDYLALPDVPRPRWLVMGVAFPGGRLPDAARGDLESALREGISLVSGLHQLLGDDTELRQLADQHGAELLDIRRPKPASELRFWNGEIFDVPAPRVAVLGTDCAAGKRTTCRMLLHACRDQGMNAAMVYTGQTGWLEGHRHGFIFDSTLNDFVSGELEGAILRCFRDLEPELILLEGQSGLRNPTGPCGSELLLSAAASGAVLQHLPGRQAYLDGEQRRLPSARDEVQLIEAYGVPVIALTLNGEGMSREALRREREQLEQELLRPVLLPLEQGVDRIVPLLRQLQPAQPDDSQTP